MFAPACARCIILPAKRIVGEDILPNCFSTLREKSKDHQVIEFSLDCIQCLVCHLGEHTSGRLHFANVVVTGDKSQPTRRYLPGPTEAHTL